jgi:hypothetical protein
MGPAARALVAGRRRSGSAPTSAVVGSLLVLEILVAERAVDVVDGLDGSCNWCTAAHYRIISAQKVRTPVCLACELLGVSRSGFTHGSGARRVIAR